VGGYALSFHGRPRATKDIDLFVESSSENAKAVYDALSSFGAPMEGLTLEDLKDPQQFIRFGREPLAVDILPNIDGVVFGLAWDRRVEAVIDSERGLKAYFISRDDLIASKMAAGRLRDLADVEDLRSSD
jgi:hypothetical protein